MYEIDDIYDAMEMMEALSTYFTRLGNAAALCGTENVPGLKNAAAAAVHNLQAAQLSIIDLGNLYGLDM